MCLVHQYARWLCGCAVQEKDQTFVMICPEKLRDPCAACSLYVVPAGGEVQAPQDDENDTVIVEDESDSGSDVISLGSTDDGEDGGFRTIEDAINQFIKTSLNEADDEANLVSETDGAGKVGQDNNEADHKNNYGVGDGSETVEEERDADGEWEWAYVTNKGRAVLPRIVPYGVALPGRNTSDESAATATTATAGQGRGTSSKADKAGVLPNKTASTGGDAGGSLSPRMCPSHEAMIEHTARAYWQSEILWLRPKLMHKGWVACRNLHFAQRCADRLWDLYHVWKFFNGGDSKGAAIVASSQFDQPNAKDSQFADVDNFETLRRIIRDGDVDYCALQWGLNDILELLRAALHPREMTN